jgi:hypothetical protein
LRKARRSIGLMQTGFAARPDLPADQTLRG